MAAIADPVRREILTVLSAGPQTAGALADRFPVSRPAVSRHLRRLRSAGLVRDEVRGRQRVYAIDLEPLGTVDVWLADLRRSVATRIGGLPLTTEHLAALDTEVARTKRARRAGSAAYATDSTTTQPTQPTRPNGRRRRSSA